MVTISSFRFLLPTTKTMEKETYGDTDTKKKGPKKMNPQTHKISLKV
jgi:hypothetical protein